MSRLASLRVTLSFLLAAAAAMIALAGIALWQVERLHAANAWVTHTREVLAQADEVRQQLLDAEAAARGYALTAQPDMRQRFDTAAAALPGATEALRRLVGDNAAQTGRVKRLDGLVDLRLEQLDEIIRLRDAQGATASQQFVASGVGESIGVQIREALVGVRAEEHALLKSRTDAAESQARLVRTALVVMGLAGAAFLAVAWRSCQQAMQARIEAERLARMGEARLLVTLQSCGDALIVTDEAGRVNLLNPVAEALTGWRSDQARGAPLDEVFRIVNEYSRETVESPVSRVLREGKIVGLANHTVLLARDGTERPIDDSGAPIRGDDGGIIGVILVFRDVTARKLSEQARERLMLAEAEREAAVKANEAKDQFLALVSHELRSPLAAIHGWVTLLGQGRLPAGEVPDALERIARNVRQQQRVIADLLDVSRILANKLEIVRGPVELGAVVQAAVDECGHHAKSKNVALRVHQAGERLFLHGDEQRLVQIVSNLVGNAVKFTPSGGAVDVRAARDDQWATIEVRDTGVGITDEELEHIFERFWQAERGTTRTHGGLGLGLALAKYIVDQHGGRIFADSPGLNRGATFTVRLPLLALGASGGAPLGEGNASDAVLTGISLLLVEDDTDSRDAAATVLRLAGAQVTAVSSVQDGLDAYERGNVQVIVTDLGMPGADGYSLAREVRRRDAASGRETPLIALTGFVGARDRGAVRDAGFAAHLEKPVDFDFLIQRIRELAPVT